MYAGFPKPASSEFADFHIQVMPPRNLRRWYRPQVLFRLDGSALFKPLPIDQALPSFEWGLNWCISTTATQYLVIHAAAIEKGGRVAIMPGIPGAGKSTLTAGLVNRGWRLLSDELAMISLADGKVRALARPISLKNASIEVMRSYVPGATFSQPCYDTLKGTVALMRAPAESIARINDTAPPAWVIFPKFENGLPACITRWPKPESFIEIAKNSFNYSILGTKAFNLLADMVEACDCYRFSYGDLNDALEVFDWLAAQR
jgi:HprK-related kinase A